MRKNACLFLLIMIFMISLPLRAGITGKISGIIKSGDTGDVLFGANVMLEGTAWGAATNANGEYYIINIPPGVYTMRVSMMGYTTTSVTEIRVNIDKTTPVNVTINPGVLQGEQITIVAERPRVELDLTASKEVLTDEEISRSWGIEMEEVIQDLPGVNINGGIRGGFGLDVADMLNGMDMRDIASNANFTSINLSTVQELEVLTGGWNAEYGQANGAIVQAVTKTSRDRIRGVVSYKFRPAGKYHWGDNIYDSDNFFHTTVISPDFWDPTSTWQSDWMEKPLPGYNGTKLPYTKMNPEERD
jgi:hypothetical protein